MFVRREYSLCNLPLLEVHSARERARRGDRDDAIPVIRAAVDHLYREGDPSDSRRTDPTPPLRIAARYAAGNLDGEPRAIGGSVPFHEAARGAYRLVRGDAMTVVGPEGDARVSRLEKSRHTRV